MAGGINLYAYTEDNPINWIDPEGMQGSAPIAPGMPLFPPILPPVFIPGTPENQMFVDDVMGIIEGISEIFGGSDEVDSCTALEAKKSGKEKASDIPSWVKGERPLPGESGKDFAKRVLEKKYGPDNYPKGPGSEYNKVKKYGDRSKKK